MEIIQQILEAKDYWLFKKKEDLDQQIHATIQAGFEKTDVFHALRWIHHTLNEKSLLNWVEQQQQLSPQKAKNVLFFHAGNLPLVGFQDVIAVLLSGHNYFGKLSRKDPFLLKGFLDAFNRIAPEKSLKYSTEVSDFVGVKADALVFSGSETGSQEVVQLCLKKELIHPHAKQLLRSAHFSIALIDDHSPETMKNLVESVLRYNGEGCRSVKMIVAPFDLYDHSCEVLDYVESWWIQTKRSPGALSEGGNLFYAFYRAIEKPILKWESKFVVQHTPTRLEPDAIYWIKGDVQTVLELKAKYGNQIQMVYNSKNYTNLTTEPLEKAQFPDLNWKPDGVDTLAWLMTV